MFDLRYAVVALVFLAPFCAIAQTGVRVIDHAAIVADADLANDRSAQAGMQASGLNSELAAKITRSSSPDQWPIGFRTDSARIVNAGALRHLIAYQVFDYATDAGSFTVVSVPALGNIHMPDDLRQPTDFFFVVRAGGTETLDATEQRAKPSMGPKWETKQRARIRKPDDVYATYDLGDDTLALDALSKAGMSQPEIDAVVFRSHERNWPDGIDTFDERYPKLSRFKQYKAFVGAQWADKVLLIVPREANKKMPVGVRPYIDIYMVFSTSAVKVKEKKRKR